jgi:antitoxin (DNA-binding transcriptional repressor) of toxin-antitoxin stability system
MLTEIRDNTARVQRMESEMNSLAETIDNALQAAGSVTETKLRDIVADFDGLNLIEEERLAAIATMIAATACARHARHKAIYLEAVRTWSLETAATLQPPPPRQRFTVELERVAEGAEILIAGTEALVALMVAQGTRTQDRLVTELALVSRLLGRSDANTIHLALGAVERAVKTPGFQRGGLVLVPPRDTTPLLRTADLALLDPRGCA